MIFLCVKSCQRVILHSMVPLGLALFLVATLLLISVRRSPPAAPHSVSQEAINMFFFIHSNPALSGRETGQSITPTRRDSVDRERPVGKQQSIPNPLHCRQQHVLTVKIVLYPFKKKVLLSPRKSGSPP